MLSQQRSVNQTPLGLGFRIFGIPVKVDPSFLLISALLALQRSAQPILAVEWVVLLFVSILIHELGHAFVARFYGQVPSIKLYSMGGLTSFSRGRELTPARSIAVSAAGPGAGFIVGGLAYLYSLKLGPGTTYVEHVIIRDVLWVNIGWGLFNLLPVWPLDGGQAARSLEEWISARLIGRKTTLVSQILAVAVAAAAVAWALANRQPWIVLLMGFFLFANGQQLYRRFGDHSDGKLGASLEEAWAFEEAGDAESALTVAQQVFKSARLEETKGEATAVIALSHYLAGRLPEAKQEIARLHACFSVEPYLALVRSGRIDRAARLLSAAFELTRLPSVGQLLGEVLIQAHREDEALELCLTPGLAGVPSLSLLAAIESSAFEGGKYELAARAGKELFTHARTGDVAYNIACALSHLSKETGSSCADEAIHWLGVALEAGFQDRQLMRTDPDLDQLRSRADFTPLLAELDPS